MKSIDVLIGSIFDVLPIILPMKRWMDMNEWYLDDHPGIIQVLYFKPMSWPFFMKGRYFFPLDSLAHIFKNFNKYNVTIFKTVY